MSQTPLHPSEVPFELVDRYRKVVLINSGASGWVVQRIPGRGFRLVSPRRDLSPGDIRAMLAGDWWIACRAPADGMTDRISLDLDASDDVEAPSLADRYWRIRNAFGQSAEPLVFHTPSGGLRVIYRIPVQPLADLVGGGGAGLIVDALRASGLVVSQGSVEVFPRATQADRLPLGRDMPLLDPATLVPLDDPYPGRRELAHIERDLRRLEEWHARPYADIVDRLRRAAIAVGPQAVGKAPIAVPDIALFRRRRGAVAPTPALQALSDRGLTRPHSRYESEWLVGLDLILRPASYTAFGVHPERFTAESTAGALATWLSMRNNGLSEEWAASVRRCGGARQAIAWWTRRYLRPNYNTGRHLVDRLLMAAAEIDPERVSVSLPSRRERTEYMAVADEYYEGAQRFRAECWMLALNRAMRGIIEHHRRRGHAPRTEIVGAMPFVVVEMASSWMQDLPGGKGARGSTGRTRYAEYRTRLHHSGLLFPRGGMVSPSMRAINARGRRDLSGEANRWAVPVHDLVTARDAVFTPWALSRAVSGVNSQGLARNGRAWTMDEVYHCLLLRRDGVRLRERYGYDCAKAISGLLTAVDPFLDDTTEPADDRDFTGVDLLALDR